MDDRAPDSRSADLQSTGPAGAARPAIVATYGSRAEGYARGQGQLEATPRWQRDLISSWAEQYDGALLDLGSGPGHLTALLSRQGRTIRGVDPVSEFVEIARRNHPGIDFALGDVASVPDEEFTGILSWYSLIHLHPAEMQKALDSIHAHLRPGGGLLVSLFIGDELREVPHPMGTTWTWPIETFSGLLEEAGFAVDEAIADRQSDPGHGFISARRL